MSRSIQLLRPQFLTIARIEGAKPAVNRRADKDEIAGGCDASAEARCPRFYPFSLELFKNAQRHMPRDIAGVDVHRDEFSPRRRITRILCSGIPEPAALRRDFSIGIGICLVAGGRRSVATTTSTAAPAARLVWIDLL